jgi:glutamate decarboxylase
MVSKLVQKEKSIQGHATTYATRYFSEPIPKFDFPEKSMPANVAYQLVHDELNLDGNPNLNLATFVSTWMEPEAEKLIMETLNKNYIDQDEYPQSWVIQERCVNMLARLFNAPEDKTAVGTSTIGSSEAIMLAGLTHKFNWRKKRKAQGKSYDKPNIVMGADVQVVWEKFGVFFDVEEKIIPLRTDRLTITPEDVRKYVDENTICVVGIVGTTFTGENEPIEEIAKELDKIQEEKGWDIPLHVDAASGGFVMPFTDPDFKWDFRITRVKSINASGHKFGLVYPGVGWVLWREEELLSEELVFHVNYLGGDMPTFTLNFSRGSSHILAQYYNFLRLGREGYTRIMQNLMETAKYLGGMLRQTGHFNLLNDDHSLPLIATELKGEPNFTVFDLSDKLRERGWIVPAYTLPPNAEEKAVLRIVCRESFSRDLAEILVEDISRATKILEEQPPTPSAIERNKKLREKQRRGVC